MVEALGPHGPDPALRVSVRPRRANGCPENRGPLGPEDLVERSRVLGVPVPDEEPRTGTCPVGGDIGVLEPHGVELLRAARDALLMATLRRGDRVWINHSARPLYLHGEPATVIGLADDTVVVRLDRPVGRFTNGNVRCPPGVLEPLRPGPVPE